MIGKRGFFLAEETLKIVIALISMSFLIYFLSSLYFADKDSQDLEFAEASLNHIIEGLNSGMNQIEIYNPEGWILASWPRDTDKFLFDTISNDMPDSCKNFGFENCLCICDDAINFEGRDCDKLGICMESEFKTSGKIEIDDSPILLSVDYEGEFIIKNES